MYSFISTNSGGHAVVIARDHSSGLGYTLRVPMTPLYATEVAYILDAEDWDPDKEDAYYGREFTMTEFLEGEAPKLISWWVQFLSPNRTRITMRRKLWSRKIYRKLGRALGVLFSALRKK